MTPFAVFRQCGAGPAITGGRGTGCQGGTATTGAAAAAAGPAAASAAASLSAAAAAADTAAGAADRQLQQPRIRGQAEKCESARPGPWSDLGYRSLSLWMSLGRYEGEHCLKMAFGGQEACTVSMSLLVQIPRLDVSDCHRLSPTELATARCRFVCGTHSCFALHFGRYAECEILAPFLNYAMLSSIRRLLNLNINNLLAAVEFAISRVSVPSFMSDL